MLVKFAKMHSLGNDFIIFNYNVKHQLNLHTKNLRLISDRHLGVGCDQILCIKPPLRPEADFYYQIFNANGEEVEQCANGARCAAKFFLDNHANSNQILIADCLAGSSILEVQKNKLVSITFNHLPKITGIYQLNIFGQDLKIYVVDFGNPHGICIVPNIQETVLKKIGHYLSQNKIFAEGANISFVQIINSSYVKILFIERGVGETFACGSGACAAMYVGYKFNQLDKRVVILLRYGSLVITYDDTFKKIKNKMSFIKKQNETKYK